MDSKQREKTRSGYFGNVKSRLGTRLPPGFTQPPGLVRGPWDASVSANVGRDAMDTGRHHIRNPKLRQYYLKEAAFPSDTSTRKTLHSVEESSRRDERAVHHEDTVFSIASQFSGRSSDSTLNTQKLSATLSDPLTEPKLDAVTPTTPVSPSTDAEYDKLLDVEAVPLPDGQLCLLALPPECTQGAESAGLPCLKLFCRFITDRKGVVSGILLVAANKIFFDPYKSLPLVQENGCEEYLFSCPVDNLSSVTFFSDISHVHFSRSTQRWKRRKKTLKGKSLKDHVSTPQSKMDAGSALVSAVTREVETEASDTVEDEVGESRDMAEVERQLEQLALEFHTGQHLCSGKQISGHSRTSSMMFVRMRQKPQLKKGLGMPEIGKAKTVPCRDAWFILQQESSDELYAYLSHHRPDLCILEGGGEEEEAEQDEDDFVILSEGEEEGEEAGRDGRTGDEWEMVCVEDSRVKESLSIDKEPDGLSDIVKQSLILNTQHVRELSSELPPRTVGHSWRLTYSTSKHGASLKTLYRKLSASDSPVLLLIRDENEQVFGGFLSHPLHPSDKFYGTGETFLFLLHPRFKCFRWTGENSFFIKGDLDSFAIGGGSGHFGLWLDESLYVGRSSPCYTFNNCSLSEKSDFRVLELEAWTFW
ncbi:oxidation resistance protein 1 isoform X1 [Hemibagrus wyckioides]|uniref:oxidation resistance protein 1 isoform X1 n=1 Tax=Hemibagrus wyckioides TaxID=337641 RepID=UPI00266C9B9B|nr:oxidation resistance protein 1 isoform X1 [Hemibagrus wyckioides]XP_058254504.1 oxidation resistance protein 1 isoform X1 [Hemibagrus wyckioides]